MPFLNRVRLPIYLRQPQWPTERSVFRRSDGTSKVLSISVRKTYQGTTDSMPEDFHEKLVIALSHDTVNIEGARLDWGVVLDGDYQVSWQEFLDNQIAPGSFQVQVTPFDETNDNCQTCAEAVQLLLEDDTFVYPLNQDESADIQVFSNDTICCFPITAEIVWYDTNYLDGASIDETTGVVTVDVGPSIFSAVNVKLATYRVTCPNGGYDEADIYGDIDGNEPDCAPPSNLAFDTEANEITFDLSPSSPADGYDYAIYACDNLGTPVFTGNSVGSPISLTGAGLAPGTCYQIAIASVCNQDLVYSSMVTLQFTPASEIGDSCGGYILENSDPFGPIPILQVSYMDCAGNIQNINVRAPQRVCALKNIISGNYYYIEVAEGSLSITPDGAC